MDRAYPLSGSLGYLRNVVEPVTSEIYAVFESEARLRLRGRDEDDLPVTGHGARTGKWRVDLWTEDADFFGIGMAVWTTNRIEIFLNEQAKTLESQEE